MEKIRPSRGGPPRQVGRDVQSFIPREIARRRSGIVLLITTVLISIVGWTTLHFVTQSLRQDIQDKLQATLNSDIEALEIWAENQRDVAASWATHTRARQEIAKLVALAQEKETTRETLLASPMLAQLRQDLGPVCELYNYIGFVLVDQRGVNIGALLDEPVGTKNLIDRNDFVQRALAGETVVSKPFTAKILLPDEQGVMRPDRPTMFAAAPVFGDSGEAIAALCFRIRPEVDFTRILAVARFGKSCETYAFDRDGVMLSDSRFNDHLRSIGLIPNDGITNAILNVHVRDPGGDMLEGFRPQGQLPLTRMATSAVRGESGFDVDGYHDYRGVTVLGAWQWLDRYGFGVTTEVDQDEAFITLNHIKTAFYAVIGLLIVSVLGVTWLDHVGNLRSQVLKQYRSELKAALDELKSQKFALDQHSIVSIADVRGKITYVNDKFCQISKYSRDELIGNDHRIVNSGHHPKAFFKEMWETIARGDVWRGEIQNRAKNGSAYWVDTSIVPYLDQDGIVTQYVSIRTDITPRKQAESELESAICQAEAANVSKSEFLANMSHEIRTPMTAILGYTDVLVEEGDLSRAPNHRVETIRTIQRNGEHLMSIINDILDLSKIEAGKMIVEQIDCSPHQILADVGALMRVRADSKGLSLGIECVGPIPRTIQSDPVRLRQILINLVGNSIKFTELGGVRVITKLGDDPTADNPKLTFEVIDTGIGITPRQMEKLFRPFSQADTSMTRKFGGTGLELTITKRFTQMLGGDITVDSTLDQGTSFVVQVSTGPLDGVEMIEEPIDAVVIEAEKAGAKPQQSTDRPLENVRILLAEDGPDNQRLISFLLKKWGVSVELAENGQVAMIKALKALQDGNPFDVILMDMQMPVMDGYTATTTLRESEYTKPIIALTAHAMAGDRDKCLNAGCDDYATKPINKTKLLATIQKHLSSEKSHAA